MPEQGQRFTAEGVPIGEPEQLTLFEAGAFDTTDEELGRSANIALECMDSGEPFFVLRAKDIFAVMGVNNYSKLVDEYGPLDVEFHAAVMDVAQEMREWQMANPERVKYPD